jgi:putative adhesin
MTMQTRTIYACVAAACLLAAVPGSAQRRAYSESDCGNRNWGDDRAGVCEVRELTIPTSGSLSVDASPNGGIQVEGSGRYDVYVRAKVTATAETEERARQIAAGIRVQPSGDRLEAVGPDNLGRREGWSVSYELAVPAQMALNLKTVNGGVSIKEVEGQIEFTTTNGGVKLTNIGGDVRGRTTNGGVTVDLDGVSWRGEGLDVQTSNGGVNLMLPEGYSARLEASTVNGGLNSDFPLSVTGRISKRQVEATIGGGGAPIKVRTSNGGVNIRKK